MVDDGALTFPDGAKARLNEAIVDLAAHSAEVLATQSRLRALLRANQIINQQLELPVVLHRIVETAIELVDASYGALGVIAPDGTLEQFIHVGMSDDDVDRIGRLPEGHGLLGAVISDPHPIRVHHLADDLRSSGFPAQHPKMDSFLGVPIRVGRRVFGNLYLTDAASGEFSADDEELVTALASTAGFAIENARLFEHSRRRQAYLAASAELTVAVASSGSDPLGLVVERVFDVSQADAVRILLPSEDQTAITVARARGAATGESVGVRLPIAGTVAGWVLQSRKPLFVGEEQVPSASRALDPGPTMAVPLCTAGAVTGVLTVSRVPGGTPFTPDDLELLADLTGRACVAIELATARSDRQRMALMEERGRIARDLHDHVIQQLFATGLELQSIAGRLQHGTETDRLEQVVAHIDESIGQIRTAVFALSPKPGDGHAARHRVIDLVGELGAFLASKPWVSFEGPVDLVIVGDLVDDVLAVVREALSNIAKHATATKVTLVVAIKDSTVDIDIENDGAGAPSSRRSGIDNMGERARRRGGVATFVSAEGKARLHWQVPIGELRDG